MPRQRISQHVGEAMQAGVSHGTTYFGSIGAGLLIGWLLDRWLGTGPWLIVGFALLGSYSGFVKASHAAHRAEERYAAERQQRGR